MANIVDDRVALRKARTIWQLEHWHRVIVTLVRLPELIDLSPRHGIEFVIDTCFPESHANWLRQSELLHVMQDQFALGFVLFTVHSFVHMIFLDVLFGITINGSGCLHYHI